ncbi:MAG: BamA/TamA family outer membrane protein [Bacteroidota bacterium]
MKWSVVFLSLLLPGFHSVIAQSPDSLVISDLEILGNKRTKHWVIERELTFLPGARIASKDLDHLLERSRDNIYNLGLFSNVRVTRREDDKKAIITILVNERFPIQGTPVLDFRERNSFDVFRAILEQRFTRLVYGGEGQLRNFTGRNETLSLEVQGGFIQKLGVEYFQPAFSRHNRLNLRLGFRFVRQKEIILGTEQGKVQWYGRDSLFLQRRIEGKIELSYRLDLYQRLQLGLSFKRLMFDPFLYQATIGGVARTFLTNQMGIERYPTLLLAYSYDKRDVKNFPMEGGKFQAFSSFSGPKPLGTSQFIKLGSTWVHHIPIKKRWNFTYGIHEVISLGDSIPYFDQQFIGIYQKDFSGLSHELRGYDPYTISGTWIHMTKAEVKFALIPYQIIRLPWRPLNKNLNSSLGFYLTAFCDLGYVQDRNFTNQDTYFKNQILIGYGPGLNIIGFYDMLVRIEYAHNHLGTDGIYINATVPIK